MVLTQQQIFGLNEQHLVTLSDGHKLIGEVADQFTKMQLAADAKGFDLQICSSHRSFDRQLSIWNRKWCGELPLYDLQNNEVDHCSLTSVERIHAIMLWSALPGASRHHWGTDFDFFDKRAVEKWDGCFSLIPQEYEQNGPCEGLSNWINENASDFGFVLPYKEYVGGVAREPWHLSYAPIADKIVQTIALDGLTKVLLDNDLKGKEVVIQHLNALFARYTLNKGSQ